MRLFHVSEEANIQVFEPRLPKRKDLDPDVGLVWAIDERHLPNFLTPRDCPRVAYLAGEGTSPEDRTRFFASHTAEHAVVIEWGWYERMRHTVLYLYEFETDDFVLQDEVAGYYVASKTQKPKQCVVIADLFAELLSRNVELRMTDRLWDIAAMVQKSTLHWSLCRMKNAQK